MWETYAAGGTGHALVFDGNVISAGAKGGERYALFPVIYDERVQVEKATKIVDHAIQLQRKWEISGEALIRYWSEEVAFGLMICGLRFKKPCFEKEQEIRLFLWHRNGCKPETANGKTHIATSFEASAIIRHIKGPNAKV
jgi:Protein of unknown function (DUF2971)